MTSEIRVNKLQNRVGLGTVEYTNTGIVVSGIVTCTELSGLTALNIAGVGTANTLDINGDIDVDGHTNLDNVSIAGVTTISNDLTITSTNPKLIFNDTNGAPDYNINCEGGQLRFAETGGTVRLRINSDGHIDISENLDVLKDLDVDGHTNLDNVSIAGVSTITGISNHSSRIQMLAGNPVRLLNDANSASCEIDCYGGAGFRLTSYNQTMFTCENGNNTKFYTDSGTSRLEITHAGDVIVNTGTLHIPDALQHSGDTNTKIRFPAADTVTVETAGSERIRITSAGFVGVGTATVGRGPLELSRSDTGDVQIHLTNAKTGGGTGNGFTIFGCNASAGDSGFVNRYNGGAIEFYTNSGGTIAERLRINSNGTSIFTGKITNSSSFTSHNANFYGGNVNTGGVRIEVAHTTTTVSGNTASASFPHHLLLSNYSGNGSADNRMCSIGFDIPTTSTHANAVIAYQATAAGTGDLQFHLESGNTISEKLRIFSNGSVGVGDYSSTNLTHAFQALRTSGSTYVSSKNTGGNALFYAEASNGNTAKLELMQAGVGNFTLEVGSTNALMFKDDGTERLRIHSNGKISIGSDESTTGLLLLDKNLTAESDVSDKNNYHLVIRSQTNSNTSKLGIAFANTTDDTHVGAAILHHRTSTDSIGDLAFYTSPSSGTLTEKMKIDRHGRITKPLNPAFKSTSTGSYGGVGSLTTTVANVGILLAGEVYDRGDNYNTTSKLFTCPVDGVYMVNVFVSLGNVGTSRHIFVIAYTNGGGSTPLQNYFECIDGNTSSYANYSYCEPWYFTEGTTIGVGKNSQSGSDANYQMQWGVHLIA